MSKDIKKALEHCIEWNCDNCPNGDELGSGETVCRGRLLPEVLEYVAYIEAKLAKRTEQLKIALKDFNDIQKENDKLAQQLADKEKEICEKIYKLFTNEIMWLTMKDWWLNNGQCRNLKEVLNAVEQGFSNQEIVENFSKDREYYHLLKKFKG